MCILVTCSRMSREWHAALVALAVSCAVVSLIYAAFRAVRSAKHRSSGVGAVGWAMLFLTSGRMPPPPPASQIEESTRGENAEGSSGDTGASKCAIVRQQSKGTI
jgi:hypothetical protein